MKNNRLFPAVEKEHVNPFDKTVSNEPVYVPEGEEFGDSIGKTKRPKWQTAGTKFQVNMLTAVGRKYYQTHNERSAVIAIEKSAVSLTGGLISIYPVEWVDQCIEWAKKKRRDGTPINLLALVNLINNADRKAEFISAWKRKNPEIVIRQSTEEDVTVEEEPEKSRFDFS